MRRVLIPIELSFDLPAPNSLIREYHGQTMGTLWHVRLVESAKIVVDLRAGVQQQLDSIVNEMSHWEQASNLSRFNRALADTWHPLPEDFFTVLSYAMTVAAVTDGAYNPTAGGLIDAWGFGATNRYDMPGFVPPSAKVIQVLSGTNKWQEVRLDPATRSAYQPGGVLLDLSSIAKGYAVDCVGRYLEENGIQHYLIEVGGELRGTGVKPDGQPWWVELETPFQSKVVHKEDTSYSDIIALHGMAIATSGDYRRYFNVDGKHFAHTLDPRTGYPLSNNVASVTVLHSNCMVADAWSTALSVLGVENGLCLAEESKLAARFLVRSDNRYIEYASSHFLEMLQ